MRKLAFLIASLISLHGHTQNISVFDAARTNNSQIISQYLEQGGNVDTTNQSGHSMLVLACYANNLDVAKLLVYHKANLDSQDRSGNTALMGAAFKGYLTIARCLLEAGADPNILNLNQANALFFAATFGHTEIAKLLLKYPINLSQKDRMGKTALDYARIQENTIISNLLQEMMAETPGRH